MYISSFSPSLYSNFLSINSKIYINNNYFKIPHSWVWDYQLVWTIRTTHSISEALDNTCFRDSGFVLWDCDCLQYLQGPWRSGGRSRGKVDPEEWQTTRRSDVISGTYVDPEAFIPISHARRKGANDPFPFKYSPPSALPFLLYLSNAKLSLLKQTRGSFLEIKNIYTLFLSDKSSTANRYGVVDHRLRWVWSLPLALVFGADQSSEVLLCFSVS
jgi:hypothetical protein